MACIEACVYPTEDKAKVSKALQTLTSVPPEQTKRGNNLILCSIVNKEEELRDLLIILNPLSLAQYQIQKGLFEIMLSKQRAFLGEIVPGKGIKVTMRIKE